MLIVPADSVLADSVLGDSVLGDSVLGDSVLGDSVLGDCVLLQPTTITTATAIILGSERRILLLGMICIRLLS
jgi:hypothetical protein